MLSSLMYTNMKEVQCLSSMSLQFRGRENKVSLHAASQFIKCFYIFATGAMSQGDVVHKGERLVGENNRGTGLSQKREKGDFKWTKQCELK